MNPTIEGVVPLTKVEESGAVTIEQMSARVEKTRKAHDDVIQAYHKVWYESEHTWVYNNFLGVGIMKCPNDLWMYQLIMNRLRPSTIIETGTYHGGSALWFAFLMDMLDIKDGRVFTVDFEAYDLDPIVRHPRITYLHGNSVDPLLVEAITERITPGPTLICLDSDHSANHVRREMELYAPLCKVGDWLVVEDTNVGWVTDQEHKIEFKGDLGRCSCGTAFMVFEELRDKVPAERLQHELKYVKCPADKGDRGARGGVQDYLEHHEGEWRQDVLAERFLLTMNPGGWLQRERECSHD